MPVVGFEIESSWRTRKHVRHALITCNRESIPVTFAEVEVILAFPLPHSCFGPKYRGLPLSSLWELKG